MYCTRLQDSAAWNFFWWLRIAPMAALSGIEANWPEPTTYTTLDPPHTLKRNNIYNLV